MSEVLLREIAKSRYPNISLLYSHARQVARSQEHCSLGGDGVCFSALRSGTVLRLRSKSIIADTFTFDIQTPKQTEPGRDPFTRPPTNNTGSGRVYIGLCSFAPCDRRCVAVLAFARAGGIGEAGLLGIGLLAFLLLGQTQEKKPVFKRRKNALDKKTITTQYRHSLNKTNTCRDTQKPAEPVTSG